jgi:hypothetical protein
MRLGSRLRKLNWREKSAMQAFAKQAVLRYRDLPGGVGTETMHSLIAKGLVELVDENIGEFAKDRRWRQTESEK